MKALGFAEAFYMSKEIYASVMNQKKALIQTFGADKLPDEFVKFYSDNLKWIRDQVKTNGDDTYWRHIGMILAQFDGLVEGYAKSAESGKELSAEDLWLYQGLQDAHDVKEKIQPTQENNGIPSLFLAGSSSMIARIEPEHQKELYVGHSAFGHYSGLWPRVTKRVKYMTCDKKEVMITMTGYAGQIASQDGFYLVNKKKVVAEVRQAMLEKGGFNVVTSDGVLGWMRVMVSNLMSAEGSLEDWANTHQNSSSNTDTKSVLLIDMSKFKRGKALEEGGARIIESWPGTEMSMAIGDILQKSKSIVVSASPLTSIGFEGMGHKNFIEKTVGAEHSEEVAWLLSNDDAKGGKLRMWKRFADTTADMSQLKELLRRNDFESDAESINPFTKVHDPCMAFGARCEQRPAPEANSLYSPVVAAGSLDAKVVSSASAAHNNFAIVAGTIWSESSAALKPASTDDLSKKVEFPHDYMPQNTTGPWDMVAFDGEGTQAIRIVMIVSIAISGSICVFGIVCTVVFLVKRRLKKKKEAQKLLGVRERERDIVCS
eukprot:MONOS_3360.1-p1 / transcript=MONOS_3360.1 / gene=MONOS_3360 / organism=Monocercomonoides_exilis_PA203 / gene_product=phospholipase B / transcript_product=phospholipase B / location=Mono_scaffold00078:111356-113141(+) / protein_length=544 / sequence_SO=supercontig / SO=protein_coding / is_pseudo=false